jgi:hypothetical protein
MQPEGDLHDIGDAVIDAFAQLIPEGLGVPALREEPLLEMLAPDNAEKLGRDRLAVLLQRRQKPSDAAMVDPLDAKEPDEGLVRAPDLGQNLALNGRAREAPELADERPHGAVLA